MNDNLEYDDTELPIPDDSGNTNQIVQEMLSTPTLDPHKLRLLWVKHKKERDDAVKRRYKALRKVKHWVDKAKTEECIITDADARIFELEGHIFKN